MKQAMLGRRKNAVRDTGEGTTAAVARRNAFPTRYMLKHMTYALELARSAGLQLHGAARRVLERTVALGLSDAYHTATVEVVRKHQ